MTDTIKCILERQSIRQFKDRQIDKEDLALILQAGVQAPNGKNLQTWRITVLNEQSQITYYKETVEQILSRTKTDFLQGFQNPAAIVIVSDRKKNYNAMVNGACALENMMLAAYSLGIGSCWINALRTIQDEPDIRNGMFARFGIPENHVVVGSIVLGYIPENDCRKKPKRRMDVIHYVDET